MWRCVPVLAWLAGCAGEGAIPDPGDRSGLLEALHQLPGKPDEAAKRCAGLGRAARGECVVAVVSARPDHAEAAAWCASLPEGLDRDECGFVRAEGTKDLTACDAAGRFAADCRLHIWSATIQEHWSDAGDLADEVPHIRAELAEAGLPDGDLAYWSAAFRYGYRRLAPLDRRPCARIPDANLVEECRRTGRAVYEDRLNHLRDVTHPRCDDPPPRALAIDDPELDAIRERRWTEICRVPPP